MGNEKNSLPMLLVLYGTAFIGAFNENIINVALVDIMAEFGIAATSAQWLVTGYMIVTCVLVVLTAWLMRRFTLRQLFFLACGFFCVAGVACMVAPVWPVLLVARLLQAVGSGVYIPLMMSTVLAVAPRPMIGQYLAYGSAAITLGPALGPVVSGAAATWFGWRAIFVLPVAACVLLAVAGAACVRNVHPTEQVHLDVPSVVFVTAGLTLLVAGLGQLSANVFAGVGLLVVGVAGIAAFVMRQRRLVAPVLSMQPFADRRFWPACVLVLVAMMTTFSMSVLLPLFFEGTFGSTALAAGLLLLPAIAANTATTVVGGRVMDARGPWPLLPVGFVCMAAGQAAICVLGGQANMWAVVAASVVVYAGVGLAMSPSQTAGLRVLPGAQHGDGVSIMNTMNMVAASIGPSLFIGILSSGQAGVLASGATETAAVAIGFSHAVLVAAVIAAAGLVLSCVYSYKQRGAKVAPAPANPSVASSEGALVPQAN